MCAVFPYLKYQKISVTLLSIVFIVLNHWTPTLASLQPESGPSCCTQNSDAVTCSNINDNASVICAQNYLINVSKTTSLPLQITFDTCDGDLLPDDFFEPFNVNGLSMMKCGLTEVPYRLFSSFCDNLIGTLVFQSNQITSLKENGFSGCRQLTGLDLSSNLLQIIKPKYFDSLDSLQSLSLNDNRITDIIGFGNLGRLQQLFVERNAVVNVDKDAFNGLSYLVALYMDYNNMRTLVNGTFDPLINIKKVLLAPNDFYCNCSLQWLQQWIWSHNMATETWCCEPIQGFVSDVNFDCSSTSVPYSPTPSIMTTEATIFTSQSSMASRPSITTTGPTTSLINVTTQSIMTLSPSQQSSVTTTDSPDTTMKSSVTATDSPDTTMKSSVTDSPDTTMKSSVTDSPDTTMKSSATATESLKTTLMSTSSMATTTDETMTSDEATESGKTMTSSFLSSQTSSEIGTSTLESTIDSTSRTSSSETSTYSTTVVEENSTSQPLEPITNVTVTNEFLVSWSSLSEVNKVMILYTPVTTRSCSDSLINEKFAYMVDGVHMVIAENRTSYMIMDYEDQGHPYLVCVTDTISGEYYSHLLCNQSCTTTPDTPIPPGPTALPVDNDTNNELWRTIGAIICGIAAALLVVSMVAVCFRLSKRRKKKTWSKNSKPIPLPRPIDTTSLSYVDPNSQSFGRNDPMSRNRELHPRDYLYLEPKLFSPRKQQHTYASLAASGTYSSIHTSPLSLRSALYTTPRTEENAGLGVNGNPDHDNQSVCTTTNSDVNTISESEVSTDQRSSVRWSAAVDAKVMLY